MVLRREVCLAEGKILISMISYDVEDANSQNLTKLNPFLIQLIDEV